MYFCNLNFLIGSLLIFELVTEIKSFESQNEKNQKEVIKVNLYYNQKPLMIKINDKIVNSIDLETFKQLYIS